MRGRMRDKEGKCVHTPDAEGEPIREREGESSPMSMTDGSCVRSLSDFAMSMTSMSRTDFQQKMR